MSKPRNWSRAEDDRLRSLVGKDLKYSEIAENFARSPSGCAGRWRYLSDCDRHGIDPYAERVLPTPRERGPGSPFPFDHPEANKIGCRRLHEQHMRVHGGWKIAA